MRHRRHYADTPQLIGDHDGYLGVPAIGSGIVSRISNMFNGIRIRWNMLMVTLGN